MPTVLVVEDNPDIRELLRYVVEAAGHTAVCAGDGATALQLVGDAPLDLALIDTRMPGMSGIELCRSLRDSHTRQGLPIIMVTAHASAADIDAAYSAGADDYVLKPFSPKELTLRMEATLAKAGRATRTPSSGLLATIAARAVHGNRPGKPDADAAQPAKKRASAG